MKLILLPNGQYQGTWGGHTLRFKFNDIPVELKTDLGVRGRDVPVRFSIVNHRVDEQSIEVEEEMK